MLESFVANYGYLALLVGSFAEGETFLVLGGLAAHAGYLRLPWVMLAAFAGSFLSGQFYFYLGRKHGRKILLRFPSLQMRIDQAQKYMERLRSPLVLIFRFLYGFRTILPLMIGMSPFPARKYIGLNAVGALIWAVSFGIAGYLFGHALEIFFGNIRHYKHKVFLPVAGAGILVWTLYFYFRRKRYKRKEKDKTPGPQR